MIQAKKNKAEMKKVRALMTKPPCKILQEIKE